MMSLSGPSARILLPRISSARGAMELGGIPWGASLSPRSPPSVCSAPSVLTAVGTVDYPETCHEVLRGPHGRPDLGARACELGHLALRVRRHEHDAGGRRPLRIGEVRHAGLGRSLCLCLHDGERRRIGHNALRTRLCARLVDCLHDSRCRPRLVRARPPAASAPLGPRSSARRADDSQNLILGCARAASRRQARFCPRSSARALQSPPSPFVRVLRG